jgi:hypothetical protein
MTIKIQPVEDGYTAVAPRPKENLHRHESSLSQVLVEFDNAVIIKIYAREAMKCFRTRVS